MEAETIDELKQALKEKQDELDCLRMEIERIRRGVSTDTGERRSDECQEFLDRSSIILELCCDLHWDFYPDTKLTIFSRKYQKITGWPQLVYENFADVQKLVHPEDVRKFMELMTDVIKGEKDKFDYEFRYRCANGRYLWLNNRCFGQRGKKGKMVYILGLTNDITDIRHKEAVLQEEKLKNSFLVKTATEYIWEYDLETKVFSFSEELIDILGWACDEYLHELLPQLLDDLDMDVAMDKKIDRIIQLINKKTNQSIWLEAAYFVLKNGRGQRYKLIGTMRNISEKKQLEEAVNYDQLTRIHSRRAAVSKLEEIYDEFVGTGHNYAVGFLDLDNFKVVNDTYGHAAGDVVLQKFADLLQMSLNSVKGTAYRWGGEEFIAVCEFTNEQDILEQANLFRSRLENTVVPWGDDEIRVTASIGISIFAMQDSGYEDVVSRADKGVYTVKSLDKNAVCFVQA